MFNLDSTIFEALLAGTIISLISIISLWLLLHNLKRFRDLSTAFIAFAAGALLGDVFWHILPEYIAENGYTDQLVIYLLGGIITSLILEAYIHCSHDAGAHYHQFDEIEQPTIKNPAVARMNLISDGIHNFLDGIALASSFIVSSTTGWASAIAIAFHEIPQELADNSILLAAGWSKRKVLIANFGTALTAILGILLVFVAQSIIPEISLILIPFAAGQFIYIATADLLPEIHHKSNWKKYLLEILMFILGILVMYLLTLVI